MDYKAAAEKLRAFAATIVEPNENQGLTADRCIVVALQQAAFDAVRDEWQHVLDAHPEIKHRAAIAKVVMADSGYVDVDPICSPPGLKPYIAVVDGKESICFDYSMATIMPLSAIFTNRVSEVLDAAEKVATSNAAEINSEDQPGDAKQEDGQRAPA